jgi:HNH endonuclease
MPRKPSNKRKPCSVDGCDRVATERGWCHGHYLRWVRLGDVLPDRPLGRRRNFMCRVAGCSNEATARGLCSAHRFRMKKTGSVRAETPIKKVAGNGYIHHTGYRIVPVAPEDRWLVDGEASAAEHRFVMARMLERPLTPDESVHHRDGNRLNNNPANLELWSRFQPRGQRVEDKLVWARDIMRRYAPEELAENVLF